MAIKDRLKYRIWKKKTFESMKEAVRKGVPPVQLMQNIFTDILERIEDKKVYRSWNIKGYGI